MNQPPGGLEGQRQAQARMLDVYTCGDEDAGSRVHGLGIDGHIPLCNGWH